MQADLQARQDTLSSERNNTLSENSAIRLEQEGKLRQATDREDAERRTGCCS